MARLIRFFSLSLICVWVLVTIAWMPIGLSVGGGPPSSVSQDDCSGTLAYSHHAENNDAASTNANGTYGCSAADVTDSWALTSAAYSTTSINDGTYSLFIENASEYAMIADTDIVIGAIGTVQFWIDGEEPGTGGKIFLVEDTAASNFIAIAVNTDDTVDFDTDDDTGFSQLFTTTGTIDQTNGTLIEFTWDFSQTAGSDCAKIRFDGGSWEGACTYSRTSLGAAVDRIRMGWNSADVLSGYYDSLKVTEEYIGG